VGGDLGPELTRIGNKAKPEWLAAWLQNPAHLRCHNAHAALPLHAAADHDSGCLSAGKSDSDYGSGVHLDAASPQQIAHGRKLIVELGCAACHEINGVQKPENFAPELSTIGSKPLAQIVFLPGMEHTLSSYIAAKIRQPRAFGASVKMPQFTLTAAQTDALTTRCLRSQAAAGRCPTICASPRSGDELPACRARGQADHRTRLLQLPPHQRQGRRYGARPYLGRERGAAAVAH
jgi:hypothetical protein